MENCKSNKKGNTNDYHNYLQISVLNTCSKIFERAVHKQLIVHLEIKDVLSKTQSGYRKNRSTDTATILVCDKIRKAIDEGHIVGMLYVNWSKAFDTLNHFALLEKLKSFGITGDAHNWFTDYILIGTNFV